MFIKIENGSQNNGFQLYIKKFRLVVLLNNVGYVLLFEAFAVKRNNLFLATFDSKIFLILNIVRNSHEKSCNILFKITL